MDSLQLGRPLTKCTFVGKVISLLLNTLSRFVIAFPPRSSRLDFIAAVTTHIHFRAQKEEICHYFQLFPFYLPWSNGAGCHDLSFFCLFVCFSFKLVFSLSSFTLIKRFFSASSLSAIRVLSSPYLRLLMFLPPIVILACNSFSLAFLVMCSIDNLKIQSDNRQPCYTPFSILNLSVVPYRVLTVASWHTYRFLRRQVNPHTGFSVLYSYHFKSFPQFIMIHTVKSFSVVHETEINVFLEFP